MRFELRSVEGETGSQLNSAASILGVHPPFVYHPRTRGIGHFIASILSVPSTSGIQSRLLLQKYSFCGAHSFPSRFIVPLVTNTIPSSLEFSTNRCDPQLPQKERLTMAFSESVCVSLYVFKCSWPVRTWICWYKQNSQSSTWYIDRHFDRAFYWLSSYKSHWP